MVSSSQDAEGHQVGFKLAYQSITRKHRNHGAFCILPAGSQAVRPAARFTTSIDVVPVRATF
jgi:hypothetical protein